MLPSDHRSQSFAQAPKGNREVADNTGMEEQNVLAPWGSGLSPHFLPELAAITMEGPSKWANESRAVGTALKSGAPPQHTSG